MKSQRNNGIYNRFIKALGQLNTGNPHDKKNWIERNSGTWQFFSTVITLVALIVSIIVMTDSKRVSNENLELYRQETILQRAQNDRDRAERLEDLRNMQIRDSLDSIQFDKNMQINDATIRVLNDQAQTAKNLLRQQNESFNLHKELESSDLAFDSLSVIDYDSSYILGPLIRNIGKASCRIDKAYMFIVNQKKEALISSKYGPGGNISPQQNIVITGRNGVPFDLVTDINTSCFVFVKYFDLRLEKTKYFYTNLGLFPPYFTVNYKRSLNAPYYLQNSDYDLKLIKKFIINKLNDPHVFD